MFSLLYTGFSACDAAERAGRMALQLCTFPFTLNILVRELFLGSVQTKPRFFFLGFFCWTISSLVLLQSWLLLRASFVKANESHKYLFLVSHFC